MMKKYNPQKAPDPEQWLALDESERIEIVSTYHRRKKEKLDNIHAHSIFHVMVENQYALGDEYPVKKAVKRLVRSGMDRHNAIHAIASVLAKFFWQIGTDNLESGDIPGDYVKEVSQLTVQKWYDEFG